MDKTPTIDPEHLVDRELIDQAQKLLEISREPRNEPVPLGSELALPEKLPESGLGSQAALEMIAPDALETSSQLHHPGFMAHMDPPTPAVAWAASLWLAATNQNLLHPDVAPKGRLLSQRVVDWLAPSFGMEGGHFVPGSTLANLTALWAAREVRGVKRVAASDKSHLSIRKAADILGLEYLAVETDAEHRLRPDQLPELSETALVLTAGTVAAGAVDPLERPDSSAWVHVDAAWAGPLKLSEVHAPLLEGVESADSVGFSAHKWMYQPKGAALVFFRDAESAHASMSYGGGYLSAPNVGLLGSAPATALPLAATLLAWGRKGMAEHLEADMARACRLTELVDGDPRFERWGPNRTGIVIWRPAREPAAEVRQRLEQAWVSLTEIEGEMWFRSVSANPSADPDFLFSRVAAALRSE